MIALQIRSLWVVSISLWLASTLSIPTYAGTSPDLQDVGEITVTIRYEENSNVLTKYDPRIQLYLLADDDDLLSQIESLREQSKPKLEPLVKHYMYTAEALTQLALKKNPSLKAQLKKEQLVTDFKTTEKQIYSVLAHYRTRIDSLIQRHTLQTLRNPPAFSEQVQFGELSPGKYRIYGKLAFATTTLSWFEPVNVKGGDRCTVILTSENMMNPYWTELNWWAFMNLDFSKHH